MPIWCAQGQHYYPFLYEIYVCTNQFDNIFIDASKMGNYSETPIINGLSDHDAQLIILHSYILRPLSKKYILTRNIND
jgi:hypothetical protein